MEKLRLDGKVAVVTGGGRGIGKAEALFLAERGAAVVVNDLGGSTSGEDETSSEPAEEVVAEIIAKGGKAAANASTIATAEGAKEIVDTAIKHFGRIDILVNNAGIKDSGKLFPDVTPEDMERQLSVQTMGYYHVTRAAWPHMVKQNYGRIIMTISSAGLYGMPSEFSYATAKGGIIGMTRSLALLAPDTIKVNALAPAAFTRMAAEIEDKDYREWAEKTRTAAQVTPIVALLSHERCPVSGQIITAASGRVARAFMAETRGYFNLHHTPEDLVEHWDEVVAEEAYAIPESAADNVKLAIDRMREEGMEVPNLDHLSEFGQAKGK